jgi:hypothetical protein
MRMTNPRMLARLGLMVMSNIALNVSLALAADDEPMDLGALLESRKELSTFNSLVRVS